MGPRAHPVIGDAYAWNLQGRFIDMSAQMAMDARFLGGMARALGLAEEAAFSTPRDRRPASSGRTTRM